MNIRFSLTLISLTITCYLFAQKVVMSESRIFNIQQTFLPPNLEVVEGSLKFQDTDGNNVINANETNHISMTIHNGGVGDANGCVAKINAQGATDGLTYNSVKLSPIQSGQSIVVDFPITSSMFTTNGEVQFTIAVEEPNGFGTNPIQLSVKTHKFDAPNVEIVSHNIASHSASGNLQKKVPFTLQLLLQNTDQGEAKDVTLEVTLPENMFLIDGNLFQQFPTLQPNEKKLISLELQTNASIQDQLDLQIALSESYGKYAKNAVIPLHFVQGDNNLTTVIIDGEDYEATQITRGSLKTITGPVTISSLIIKEPFTINSMSSVLVTYNNMFAKYEMPDKDEPFPYSLIRVSLKGDPRLVRLATQSLSLDMGQFYATEQMVPLEDKILFLVSSNVKNIYIRDGSGQRQLLFSGRLIPNKIYDGVIEVK